MSKDTTDDINSPSHYTTGGIETWQFTKAKLGTTMYRGYLLGSVIKYVSRCLHKGATLKDLRKARWFIDMLIVEYASEELKENERE